MDSEKELEEILLRVEQGELTAKQAKKDIMPLVEDHGKTMKKWGAVGMARLAKKMRDAQKRYFVTKSKEALAESKRLEGQFDRAVDVSLKVKG